MDQASRGFWPPVTPQVPQNYMRNTSQRCGVAGLMSGAYQGQIGVDVGFGSLRGRVPVSMLAVESPLGMGLHGLGDACGVATTVGTIANVIGQIMQTVGMSIPRTGATHAYGTRVTAGAQAFTGAMQSACPTRTPTPGPAGSSSYEQQMLAMVQAQQAAQAQAARDQAKALQEQKSNTMLLVGGGVVVAAIIGVALYLKR